MAVGRIESRIWSGFQTLFPGLDTETVSSQSRYNIPEYATPQKGVESRDEARFYYGDYSDGFEPPTKKVRPHRHPYCEIFWLPEPTGAFLSDFRTFPLGGACLVFVSPGQVHGWPGAERLKGYMLAFDEAFLGESDRELLRAPLFYDADSSPLLSVEDTGKVGWIWEQIAEEFGGGQSNQVPALQALLRLLLISAHRLRDTGEKSGVKRSSGVQLYEEFVRLLSGELLEMNRLKDYAKCLGVTADYLSECVMRHSGRKAGEMIRQRITLESKRLLAHSELTIAEIAYRLHFKDPSYFSRFFRQQTGRRPKEFRKQSLDI